MKLLKLSFQVSLIFAAWVLVVPGIEARQNNEDPDTIKIGLLIPYNNSLSARHGAEMAILKANEAGGYEGHPFQLVIHSMEGPWGTGSKQAVDLIFKAQVWAIMGSHDGRNSHLVEQVTAKTKVVFLSSWASDPTLSKAFVPWYFSCIPNDLQQAQALTEEIYNKRKISKVGTLSDNGYDSGLALKSFIKVTKTTGKAFPVQFFYDDSTGNFNNLLDQIDKANVSCIVLFGKPAASMKIITELRKRKMNLNVFASLSVLGEEKGSDPEMKIYDSVVLVSSGYWLRPQGIVFREEYYRKYGNIPGEVAAYSYDGMNLILEAIRNTGLDRNKLQQSMAKIHFNGVTGSIQFDDKGNRIGDAMLIEVKNGISIGGD
jgi:branched-chain amino acid transport system substrate-binding protein